MCESEFPQQWARAKDHDRRDMDRIFLSVLFSGVFPVATT